MHSYTMPPLLMQLSKHAVHPKYMSRHTTIQHVMRCSFLHNYDAKMKFFSSNCFCMVFFSGVFFQLFFLFIFLTPQKMSPKKISHKKIFTKKIFTQKNFTKKNFHQKNFHQKESPQKIFTPKN